VGDPHLVNNLVYVGAFGFTLNSLVIEGDVCEKIGVRRRELITWRKEV